MISWRLQPPLFWPQSRISVEWGTHVISGGFMRFPYPNNWIVYSGKSGNPYCHVAWNHPLFIRGQQHVIPIYDWLHAYSWLMFKPLNRLIKFNVFAASSHPKRGLTTYNLAIKCNYVLQTCHLCAQYPSSLLVIPFTGSITFSWILCISTVAGWLSTKTFHHQDLTCSALVLFSNSTIFAETNICKVFFRLFLPSHDGPTVKMGPTWGWSLGRLHITLPWSCKKMVINYLKQDKMLT